jgi:hypothetical protein
MKDMIAVVGVIVESKRLRRESNPAVLHAESIHGTPIGLALARASLRCNTPYACP